MMHASRVRYPECRALSEKYDSKKLLVRHVEFRYLGGMPETTTAPHIWMDERGRAWIDDTNVKVIEVVLDHVAYGWSAEEIHAQHSHLSLSQIYAALGYYYDHLAECDREIEASRQRAVALAAEVAASPLRQRLRAAGKL
jgi:uncharacterized protein (DUF433 family)